MLLIDGVCTLANVVIIDLTQVNLVSQVVLLWGCYNNDDSNERWSLSELVPGGHVSFFISFYTCLNVKVFLMSTPKMNGFFIYCNK